MTLRELLCNHDRSQIENWVRARARTATLSDAVLCRSLGIHNLYVDPSNFDMAPWLMLDGFWEMWITMAIGRATQPGWTCIDAGSWCGYYSVAMADLVGPKGKMIAFEPNQTHHKLCLRSLKSNGHTWATCHNYALSDSCGTQTFFESDGGGSRLSPIGESTAKTVTIDDTNPGKVDLIKMDIEGAELEAWEGMQKTIDANPNIIIVMEVNSERYKNAIEFYTKVEAKFPEFRTITTDGATREIKIHELLKADGEQMLWLQN